jgi:hypothetical protein
LMHIGCNIYLFIYLSNSSMVRALEYRSRGLGFDPLVRVFPHPVVVWVANLVVTEDVSRPGVLHQWRQAWVQLMRDASGRCVRLVS